VSDQTRSSGRYPLDAMGVSHTARLVGGVPAPPTPQDELAEARARKALRDRKVISRTDAFRGKDD
jgi:hypothetical protein